MKNVLILFLFSAFTAVGQQRETLDLATYTIPKGWKKVNSANGFVAYAVTNSQTGGYAQIILYSSALSKGSLKADFESEWEQLIVKSYQPKAAPELSSVESSNGWTAQVGAAPFEFNGGQSAAMLITATGFDRCMSIVVLTNTDLYQPEIGKFLESVDLSQPTNYTQTTLQKPVVQTNSAPSGAFRFSTTNFDDGWVSNVHEDWVEVSKGNILVLLHFSSNKVDVSSGDHVTISNNAWNALVAPRYSNLLNYHVLGSTLSYERTSLISGDVSDNGSGKRHFVALFKKGKSGWIEIICPDKQTFINAFGVDPLKVDYYVEDNVWNPLVKMQGYNKFAVDASDLRGTWSNNFGASTQYVNAYTGASAGMDTYSSTEKFEFGAGNTYKWNIASASGFVGNIKYQGAKSSGTFSLPNNWQVTFPDIEGRSRTYDAYFSCVKGARILWLGETGFGKID